MQESKYPPFLDLILENRPKSALLYVHLWRLKIGNSKVLCNKSEVVKDLLFSWKEFRSDLRHLESQGVLFHSINLENDEATIDIFTDKIQSITRTPYRKIM